MPGLRLMWNVPLRSEMSEWCWDGFSGLIDFDIGFADCPALFARYIVHLAQKRSRFTGVEGAVINSESER